MNVLIIQAKEGDIEAGLEMCVIFLTDFGMRFFMRCKRAWPKKDTVVVVMIMITGTNTLTILYDNSVSCSIKIGPKLLSN